MQHHLIPSRDAQIVNDLSRGVSVADLAAQWNLGEAYVRQIARLNGVRVERTRRHVDPTKAYLPSPAARAALTAVGIDPDTIPGRHLVCSSRDAALMEMLVVDAVTLDAAGKKYGLTRERVRQIHNRYLGVSVKAFHERRLALIEQERRDQIAAYAARHPAATGGEIADVLGVRVCDVRDVLGADQVALRERPVAKGVAAMSDEEIFADLRRVAALPGGLPLRSTFFDAHKAPEMVSVMRIHQRFGTWREACEAAGVVPMPSQRPSYTRRWSLDDLRSVLDAYVAASWGSWSYKGFEAWLRTQPDSPSAQTVRNQLGDSWQRLLQAAIARVNERDGDEQVAQA